MVERETARVGLEALLAAIAELSEGVQDIAVRPLSAAAKAHQASVAELRRLADDVVALASAMEVLQRRAT